ncbi:GNAT family N-acetyltransferase [Pseudoalteromonas denitrificans]|uniref:Predicted acetyltransferase n=1 Tax=Pseudoalteromonas denitrificans DSM 6059 TaxID=1123010 RepID=A0A1I1LYN7_9GAMM|nr:GNAT family N-acetyltransferase [Pseudoalteromonas denitrificans]SFC78095.1 Predicted acetyltransferase [Pseudoalteromonas denitrificans DSM 6059]
MEMVLAQEKHLKSYEVFLSECFTKGIEKYGVALDDPKAYLAKVINQSKGKELPEGFPRTSTYFCIYNDEIIGAIRYRHGTNAYIENVIGHIGYETKPEARGRGVAKFMLSWLQQNILIGNAIITCEANNPASRKVIENCGAKYINQIFSREKNGDVIRFQLT